MPDRSLVLPKLFLTAVIIGGVKLHLFLHGWLLRRARERLEARDPQRAQRTRAFTGPGPLTRFGLWLGTAIIVLLVRSSDGPFWKP